MKKLIYILFVCFLFAPASIAAQVKEKIEKAYALYNGGELNAAAEAINEVVESPEGKNSKVAWHIRGFIYKDIYLEYEDSDLYSKARKEALISHKTCIANDPEGSLVEQSRNAIKYLSVSYYNDAIEIIDSRDPLTLEDANLLYDDFKKVTLYLYPDSVMKTKDIEFYLAMSTAHRKIYERNRDLGDEHWEVSNSYLEKVLELDPENWPALYSTSVAHYNKGAYNLDRLPEAQGITDIYRIEAESMRSIQVALPFMIKAYQINPEKIEAVKGLKTIYHNLDREEESNEMRELEIRLEETKKH